MPEFTVIGKRFPRVDAHDKVTGKSMYAADIVLPNMLHGKILRSPYAHARIKKIDTSRAVTMEGVMAVITAADAPGLMKKDSELNPMLPMLAREKVVYVGQPLAAVAALNPNIAEEALSLIDVEYEVLTPVLDVLEAMRPDAPVIHPDLVVEGMPRQDKTSNTFFHVINNIGDIEAGFKEADIIQENTFHTGTVHQGYLEIRAAVADVSSGGKITVWADNQGIFVAREQIAEFLEIPLNRINVIPVDIGGAFGGKEPQIISPLCALLALKTGRPVKIVVSRADVFVDTRPAPATCITVKMGAKKDGTITAVSTTMIYDFGARYGVHGFPEVPFATFTALSPYKVPNMKIEAFSVFTNKAPSGPYRSPSAPQGAFAMESQLDLMARELGIDPIDFRLKNAVAEGDFCLMGGGKFARIGFKEVLQKMKEHLSTRSKPEGEYRGRGVGCGFWAPGSGPAAASISLNADGSVMVTVGAVDISGSRTSLTQIAAESMELPFEKVTVTTGDTDTAPFSVPAVGSMLTRSAGSAIFKACQDLKEQICQRAAEKLEVDVKDIEYKLGQIKVKGQPAKSLSLEEIGNESVNAWIKSPIIGRGSMSAQEFAPVFTCQSVDVEVDKETGKVTILSYATAQDLGVAVNPTLVEGQIQGAAAQGIGWALNEAYVFNKDGILQNPTFLDYRMPTALDVPFIDALIVETPSTTLPFHIRGAGEPPFVACLGTIANAVHSATGVRIKQLPMNPEAVLNAIKSKGK